jgi:hypothetical protein
MAAVIHRQNGYTTSAELATQLINDLKDNGFSVKYVNSGLITDNPVTATVATLEAGADVDPLAATQPWRIQVDGATASTVTLYFGTANQLPDGAGRTGSPLAVSIATNAILGASLLCNYNLIITPRGIFVRIYTQGQSYGYYGLACVQRPVDRSSGAVLQTGYAPVFAVSIPAAANVTSCQRGVVRESDITTPSAWVTILSPGITGVNAYNLTGTQPPLLDSAGNYVITQFTAFATGRLVYLFDCDLMLMAPSAGFTDGGLVTLSMYGSNRGYTSIRGAGPTPTSCASILFLTSGGGLP